MERSKLIFAIVAIAVCVVVVLVLLFLPGGQEQVPTEPVDPSAPTGGVDGTDPMIPTDPYVPPTSVVLPPDTPTMPLPTEGESGGLISSFVPDEVDPADLPKSSGANYMNQGPVGTTVYFEGETYLITLGVQVDGLQNYMYLNPAVSVVGKPNFHITDFQFVFIPADGYVTTITPHEKGDYTSSHGCTTFEKALDYGLPAAYVSQEWPGTVWYRDEIVISAEHDPQYVPMQVLVYAKGNFLASLLYVFSADVEGTYYMGFVGDLNQVEMVNYFHPYSYRMEAEMIEYFYERVKVDAAMSRPYGFTMEAEKLESLTLDDLIIEWREPGVGTYFDYACSVEDDGVFVSSESLQDSTLVAVSIRRGHNSVYKGPTTFYYRMNMNGTELASIELVAIEGFPMYHKYLLYINGYPGYSEPLWDR